MNNRLFNQGVVTTILGIIMLIFCGILIYQGKESASELSGWLAVALLFLRSKDSLLFGSKNMNDKEWLSQ